MSTVEVNHFKFRYWIILGFLLLLVLLLISRMFQLTLLERNFLTKAGDARTSRVISIPAYRGMITDRFGQPLAVSVPVNSIWVNPQQFVITDPKIHQLLKLLGYNKKALEKKIASNNTKEFLYLKRQVDPKLTEKILALHIPGIYALNEYKRYYPQGEVSAPLMGRTNIDDQGQEGLELAYENWLKGVSGKEQVTKDLYGHVVTTKGIIAAAKPGNDLQLSIDSSLQYLAYSELKNMVLEKGAESGNMVIMKVDTGEVLSMVSYPSFNPNQRSGAQKQITRNRTVTDIFEPGSTLKAFSVVNALMSGKYHEHSMIDTSPGWFYINNNRIIDSHNNGLIDLTTILQKSSNVGVAKITLSMPPKSLWHLLNDVGFGQTTGSSFPGESGGNLPHRDPWPQFALATLSFGYGLNVTTLQLAQAYAILANEGKKMPVSLIKVEAPSVGGEQIIRPAIAKTVLKMLQSVIAKGGTATAAQIPGYIVAGKTGTVRIVGQHGYEKNRHTAIFVGAVPATKPVFVAAVVITDPKSALYYGGYVAAPVFSKVLASALREYNISPDAPIMAKEEDKR